MEQPATGLDCLKAGIRLINRQCFKEALPLIERAVAQLQEDTVAACCCRAVILGEMGDPEAIAVLDQILGVHPDHSAARYNRACLRMETKDLAGAISDFDRILAQGETEFKSRSMFGKGFAYLVMGELKEGFIWFESRKKRDDIPKPSQPEWDGKESLAGKTILIFGEMGYGDNIMFARYVPMLRALGARVKMGVPPSQVSLMACLDGVEVYDGSLPVEFDTWVWMMSLAHRFGTDIDTVPPPAKFNLPPVMGAWGNGFIGPKRGLRVGLCWAGNTGSLYDKWRTVPLKALEPLFDVPGVNFYSLQLEIRDSDRPVFEQLGMVDNGKSFKTFLDTAVFISGLDLVITVDTSICHLAGTLGVPTLTMLTCYRTYWKWIFGRDDTPWYPGMRSFMQPAIGDWASVVAKVKVALERISDVDARIDKQTAMSGRHH